LPADPRRRDSKADRDETRDEQGADSAADHPASREPSSAAGAVLVRGHVHAPRLGPFGIAGVSRAATDARLNGAG
jgi:hypothetical protein